MILLLLFAASLAGTQASAVTGVAFAKDGDSLSVGGVEIRLHGIDAPELAQICTRSLQRWTCGSAARAQLSALVSGRQVSCQPLGEDQYGRTLARCSVLGRDINEAMVESGYAVAFRKYSTAYVAAENRAMAATRGIWASTFQMPEEYRADQRSGRTSRAIGKRPGSSVRVVSSPAASGGCVIKGNHSRRGEWIYHVPGMPYYAQTRAEAMFCSEAEARAAGYRRARVH